MSRVEPAARVPLALPSARQRSPGEATQPPDAASLPALADEPPAGCGAAAACQRPACSTAIASGAWVPRWPHAEPLCSSSAACQKPLGEPSGLSGENQSACEPPRRVYDGLEEEEEEAEEYGGGPEEWRR